MSQEPGMPYHIFKLKVYGIYRKIRVHVCIAPSSYQTKHSVVCGAKFEVNYTQLLCCAMALWNCCTTSE